MNQVKQILKKVNFTKWRLLWLLIAAAWIFVILKIFAGAVFEKNTSLVAAFSATNPEEISAKVEVTAKYPIGKLSDRNKLLVLEEVADIIGLRLTMEPEMTETKNRQEIRYVKEALAANTELKIISLEQTQSETETYLYVGIELNRSLNTVLEYKELLEEQLEKLSCTEISTTIQLTGDYAGYLPLERRDEITEKILKALGAAVVYEYREHDLYTVYAYTAGLDNYITVDNKKINVHIAMSQMEEHYRTVLYLASPILPDTW